MASPHSICHSRKPHAARTPHGFMCFIEPELLPIEVLYCENRDFVPFCSCDLDLDPITFTYAFDLYSLQTYRMCKYELRTKVVVWQTDRQTRPKLYTQWTIKKRDILFFTITLANLNRFSQFFYHFNREEILHATILKFITSPDLCAHLTWKNLNLHFCHGS